jgi:hypothetical protein
LIILIKYHYINRKYNNMETNNIIEKEKILREKESEKITDLLQGKNKIVLVQNIFDLPWKGSIDIFDLITIFYAIMLIIHLIWA